LAAVGLTREAASSACNLQIFPSVETRRPLEHVIRAYRAVPKYTPSGPLTEAFCHFAARPRSPQAAGPTDTCATAATPLRHLRRRLVRPAGARRSPAHEFLM